MQVVELRESEFPRTWNLVSKAIENKIAPGMVAGFWQVEKPRQMTIGAWGVRKWSTEDFSKRPQSDEAMTRDTIFDLASLTKVLGTSALAALLVERKWISWNTPVKSIFPADYPHTEIRIGHLLSHTGGYQAWAPFWQNLRDYFQNSIGKDIEKVSIAMRQEKMRDLVLTYPLQHPVNQIATYSDISFLVLGFALEEVIRLPLYKAIERWVWMPMGLEDSFFQLLDKKPSLHLPFAATERCLWRGRVLEGEVHDDNCWAMGGYGGHAGAFSTAQDILKFVRNLFGGFFSLEILQKMWTRVVLTSPSERTLGWDTPSGLEPSTGKYFSSNTVGHLGFTGTSLWIDLQVGLAVTLLSNRVHPNRENDKFRPFRAQFHDCLREDLNSS